MSAWVWTCTLMLRVAPSIGIGTLVANAAGASRREVARTAFRVACIGDPFRRFRLLNEEAGRYGEESCELRRHSTKNDRVFANTRRARSCDAGGYSMCQPWLTITDWPVSAFEGKAAKKSATSATSAKVVNSPSTVVLSITFLITSCSVMPNSFACSGICFSISGVRTKPGQIVFARIPNAAPSLATDLHSPMIPCFAATYGALSGDASLEWTDPI